MSRHTHTQASHGPFVNVRAILPPGGTYNVTGALEANIFQYFNEMKKRGLLHDFEYEPKDFKFPSGAIYRIDWELIYPDGTCQYCETKGWMDDRSVNRIKHYFRHYPEDARETWFIVEDEKAANKIRTIFSGSSDLLQISLTSELKQDSIGSSFEWLTPKTVKALPTIDDSESYPLPF